MKNLVLVPYLVSVQKLLFSGRLNKRLTSVSGFFHRIKHKKLVFAVHHGFAPDFGESKASESLGCPTRYRISAVTLDGLGFGLPSCEHSQVVGEDRGPDVGFEVCQPFPSTTRETVSAFEAGDSRLYTGPEVA